ncbi:hypothetical protein H4R33_000580, partial [Dimargaris cristalligena]
MADLPATQATALEPAPIGNSVENTEGIGPPASQLSQCSVSVPVVPSLPQSAHITFDYPVSEFPNDDVAMADLPATQATALEPAPIGNSVENTEGIGPPACQYPQCSVSVPVVPSLPQSAHITFDYPVSEFPNDDVAMADLPATQATALEPAPIGNSVENTEGIGPPASQLSQYGADTLAIPSDPLFTDLNLELSICTNPAEYNAMVQILLARAITLDPGPLGNIVNNPEDGPISDNQLADTALGFPAFDFRDIDMAFSEILSTPAITTDPGPTGNIVNNPENGPISDNQLANTALDFSGPSIPTDDVPMPELLPAQADALDPGPTGAIINPENGPISDNQLADTALGFPAPSIPTDGVPMPELLPAQASALDPVPTGAIINPENGPISDNQLADTALDFSGPSIPTDDVPMPELLPAQANALDPEPTGAIVNNPENGGIPVRPFANAKFDFPGFGIPTDDVPMPELLPAQTDTLDPEPTGAIVNNPGNGADPVRPFANAKFDFPGFGIPTDDAPMPDLLPAQANVLDPGPTGDLANNPKNDTQPAQPIVNAEFDFSGFGIPTGDVAMPELLPDQANTLDPGPTGDLNNNIWDTVLAAHQYSQYYTDALT